MEEAFGLSWHVNLRLSSFFDRSKSSEGKMHVFIDHEAYVEDVFVLSFLDETTERKFLFFHTLAPLSFLLATG